MILRNGKCPKIPIKKRKYVLFDSEPLQHSRNTWLKKSLALILAGLACFFNKTGKVCVQVDSICWALVMVLTTTRFSFACSQFWLKLGLPVNKGEVYVSCEVRSIKLWLTQGKKVTWQYFKYIHQIRNTIYHQSQKNTSFSKISLWFHKLCLYQKCKK